MRERGYTLIETLVAIIVMGFVFAFLGQLIRLQMKVQTQNELASNALLELRNLPERSRPEIDETATCIFDVIARRCR